VASVDRFENQNGVGLAVAAPAREVGKVGVRPKEVVGVVTALFRLARWHDESNAGELRGQQCATSRRGSSRVS
jgi:hypothetical protein